MAETVHLQKGDFDAPAPCWIPIVEGDPARPAKPVIKCQCGAPTGIGLHHVHADGRVTQSFLHDKPAGDACGWHVFLILDGWSGQDFPPERS
jgi:hypothetical protein